MGEPCGAFSFRGRVGGNEKLEVRLALREVGTCLWVNNEGFHK